jgi:predicted ester cyclase
MPVDEIETRYCQYVEEVLNHHHLHHLAAYLAPDVLVHGLDVAGGLAAAQHVLASYLAAFPDLHLTIHTLLAQDGELLARLTGNRYPHWQVPGPRAYWPAGARRRLRSLAVARWQVSRALAAAGYP